MHLIGVVLMFYPLQNDGAPIEFDHPPDMNEPVLFTYSEENFFHGKKVGCA
jgi:hypothetical protein